MGIYVRACLVLYFVCGAVALVDVFQNPLSKSDQCVAAPPGGVAWILHVREPNFGWGENTHRANIALAVSNWRGTDEEMTKMELQLEEEILKSLQGSSTIHENDLALFIHALIATKKNPRNFHGIDLVADLLERVNSTENVHPYLVLALCNAHAVEFSHLEKIKRYTVRKDGHSTHDTQDIEMKALALKALACAANLPDARSRSLDKHQHAMKDAEKCLISHQVDGVFGNSYTTSLAVQALTAFGDERWDEEKSLNFLRKESEINVSIIKTYYIQMALNARRVKFIKDLYEGPYDPESPAPDEYYTSYTIKDEQNPHIYFSVIMKIPDGWNFFQVMEKASNLSNRFEFSYFKNNDNDPMVYQVIGKPNDAEENMFWVICRQTNINHDPHTSNITTYVDSPAKFKPLKGEHVILWYRSSECPKE